MTQKFITIYTYVENIIKPNEHWTLRWYNIITKLIKTYKKYRNLGLSVIDKNLQSIPVSYIKISITHSHFRVKHEIFSDKKYFEQTSKTQMTSKYGFTRLCDQNSGVGYRTWTDRQTDKQTERQKSKN